MANSLLDFVMSLVRDPDAAARYAADPAAAIADAHLTDPAEAETFVKQSGCDSLACAIGTSHGAFKFSGSQGLHFDVLAAIHAVDYRAVGLEEFGHPGGFLERPDITSFPPDNTALHLIAGQVNNRDR